MFTLYMQYIPICKVASNLKQSLFHKISWAFRMYMDFELFNWIWIFTYTCTVTDFHLPYNGLRTAFIQLRCACRKSQRRHVIQKESTFISLKTKPQWCRYIMSLSVGLKFSTNDSSVLIY